MVSSMVGCCRPDRFYDGNVSDKFEPGPLEVVRHMGRKVDFFAGFGVQETGHAGAHMGAGFQATVYVSEGLQHPTIELTISLQALHGAGPT